MTPLLRIALAVVDTARATLTARLRRGVRIDLGDGWRLVAARHGVALMDVDGLLGGLGDEMTEATVDEHREHDADEDCWCGPTAIPVTRDDGSIGWTYAHHQSGMTPEAEAERAAAVFQGMELVRREDD